MSSFGKKVTSAVSWKVLSGILNFIITFGSGIILARSIEPKDFGLFYAILAVVGLSHVFAAFPTGTLLIQNRDRKIEYLAGTAFRINAVISIIASVIALVFGCLNFSETFYIVCVLAFCKAFEVLTGVHSSLITRFYKVKKKVCLSF